MQIKKLRTNHVRNPIGYLIGEPVFSYQVTEVRGKKQACSRIRVSKSKDMSSPIYDSGECTNMDSIAFRAPVNLEPRIRYYWTVTVTTDVGEMVESETTWFETGKMTEAWEGQWICSELNEGTHPIFFRNLPIKSPVQKARLYICGLGLYEAYLDGEKVSDEYLTPYCNDYDQWIQYQSYDITNLLKKGETRLEVLLGNGWYKGRFGLDDDGSTEKLYGDTFLLIAEVRIEYQDGSCEVIGTDENWQARKSKILNSSFYNGEYYDETFCEGQVYPVSRWEKPMARLCERLSLPIKVKEILKPIKEIHTSKGELVLDLGQNHSGWFELKVNEPKDTKLALFFGEELQDGCFDNSNLRTGKQEYFYTSDGQEHIIRPHFTSYGYRYVKLEGFQNFSINDYTGLVLYSDLTVTGQIHTGNKLVDRLALNALWGQKSNFLDIPMDCPQRDERMGWTGDAQVFTRAACFNMDSYAFYRKFLYDMYEEQKSRDGAVPFVIPACGQTASCGIWGDAATIMPFALYEYYGDKTILKEQYASMKSWVDYIKRVNGDNWHWREIYHFGDWLALDSRNEKMPTGGTDVGYVATAYYYHSTRLVEKAAQILGNEKDEKAYKKRADELLEEIQKEYFSISGRLCIDTQTGYLLALKFCLAPDHKRIVKDLRQAFKRNEDKLETGFVGTSMLCNVLSENGLNELAYDILLSEDYPGWLYSVKNGATTIWERWDSLDETGHFSPSGLNSLNHYSYGSIVEWLFRYSAGLAPRLESPGFREVTLHPRPDYRLGKMDASFDSPIGIYRSRWEVTKDFGLKLQIEIPFGGKAYLTLPYASDDIYQNRENVMFRQVEKSEEGYCCVLEAGSFSVEYATIKPMRKIFNMHSTIKDLMENDKAEVALMQMIPMITMLPESMYGRNLQEIFEMSGKNMTPDEVTGMNQKLMEIQ